jgi:magnesium-transporting ATPase (P-type)
MTNRSLDDFAPLAPLEACAELGSAPQGLSEAEATARLARVGPNAISDELDRWSPGRVLAPFVNWITGLLLAAGGLAFISETPAIGWTILAIALLNGLFTVWQEYQAEKAIAALRHLLPPQTFVRRDGHARQIPTAEVVPGDILPLAPSTVVVADGYLITSEGLRVRQTLLTGSNAPVTKIAGPLPDVTLSLPERPNVVLAGAQVIEGQGSLLAVATGMRTQLGAIASATAAQRAEQSPFVRALNQLAGTISRIAILAGLATFALMVGRGYPWQASLIFAISMIVAFVPEGLLPTVTLAMALARRRLQRRQVLVKRLSDVESLGAATVLCFDQVEALAAGTLMTTDAWAAGQAVSLRAPHADDGDLRALLEAAALANNARLLPPEAPGAEPRLLGSPVDAALLRAAAAAGVDVAALAERHPRLQTLPYEPRRQLFCVIIGSAPTAVLRGEAAAVLPLCTSIRRAGRDEPLDDAGRAAVRQAIDAFARAGMQVIALARKRLGDEASGVWNVAEVTQGLTLLGLLGLQQPPQPEVTELLVGCRRAGVRPLVVTGAYGLLAEASARRAGMIRGAQARIITGAELRGLAYADLDAALRGETIFAQLDAEDKRRIVARLQELGEVVAFLGDSVNDAPALKQADVGIALSASGTTVALAAADLVLDAAHPAGLLVAMREGRTIFRNVQKLSGYIFTHNVAESVAVVTAIILGAPLPLTVLQVLAIDLGSELVPSVALSTEPPEPGIMDEPPRPRDAPIISRGLLLQSFLWLGLLQGAMALCAYGMGLWSAGWRPGAPWPSDPRTIAQATTLAYAAIVLAQIGNALASRTQRASILAVGFWRNRAMLVGVAASLAVMLALIYLPPLAHAVGMVPPTPGQWAVLLTFPLVLLLAEEGRKQLLRSGVLRATGAVRRGGDGAMF